MAIFDDIIRTTQKAGKAIADTATDVYGFTKVSYNLASLESKLRDVLVKIGRYTVDVQCGGQADEEHLAFLMAQVEELEMKIESATMERAQIKHEVVCPACNHPNPKNNVFCAACGAKLVQD